MGSPALNPRLQLLPPGTPPRVFLFALCVLLPIIIVGVALFNEPSAVEPGRMIMGGMPPSWVATLGGTLALLLLVWFVLDRAMHRHRLQLTDSGIEIKTTFYSESVAWADLSLDAARVVDLDERTELKPARKTNGYSVPGFKSGRFRLKNGEKAFVTLSGERRALWLPTSRGFGLLLQPQQPDALLKRVRELAVGTARR